MHMHMYSVCVCASVCVCVCVCVSVCLSVCVYFSGDLLDDQVGYSLSHLLLSTHTRTSVGYSLSHLLLSTHTRTSVGYSLSHLLLSTHTRTSVYHNGIMAKYYIPYDIYYILYATHIVDYGIKVTRDGGDMHARITQVERLTSMP
jgi:hypothetical protein